jgi:hypothetical protein
LSGKLEQEWVRLKVPWARSANDIEDIKKYSDLVEGRSIGHSSVSRKIALKITSVLVSGRIHARHKRCSKNSNKVY